MKYLFLISFFPILSFAQHRVELYKDENAQATMAREKAADFPEIHLKDESVINDLNKETGVKDKFHYTGNDKHRLSAGYHAYGNPLKFSEFSSLEANYGYKAFGVWWEGFISRSESKFESVSENKTPNTTTTIGSEARFQRPGDAKQNLTSYGLGVGYRFRSIYEFLKIENLFETISVFGVKHTLDESFRDISYSGYGLRADYGIHKRSSTSFFYGLKGSYQIGKVTRTLDPGEIKSEGTLSLAWYSLGFEMGYFY